MLDALVGAVIMVVATTSLLYSVEVADKAFHEAGRYPLNDSEIKLLESFGLDLDGMDEFWVKNIENSWDQWGRSGEVE